MKPLVYSFLAATALLAFAPIPAHADSFEIRIGAGGPPPRRAYEEHRWARPYRTAVWIPGHYEWVRGNYRWIGGYYDYPPRPGARWIEPRYNHHHGEYYYRPGRWVD